MMDKSLFERQKHSLQVACFYSLLNVDYYYERQFLKEAQNKMRQLRKYAEKLYVFIVGFRSYASKDYVYN